MNSRRRMQFLRTADILDGGRSRSPAALQHYKEAVKHGISAAAGEFGAGEEAGTVVADLADFLALRFAKIAVSSPCPIWGMF